MTANEFIVACVKLGVKADGEIVFPYDTGIVLDFCEREVVDHKVMTFIHHQMNVDHKGFFDFQREVILRGLGNMAVFVERPNGKCRELDKCIIGEFMQGNIYIALD